MLPDDVLGFVDPARDGLVVWLTGAGISAESGIPTFRGPEGYWRVGSRSYRPMELATFEAFSRSPDDVWAWYLHRRSICREAAPNAGHEAIARADAARGERHLLITQNVDGLHRRAGSSPERTYEIHGNIDIMRCVSECGADPVAVPDRFDGTWEKGRALTADERAALRCSRCGSAARPHVLWFDESYDEARFRYESSLRAAAKAALLIIVGTTGATNLPVQVASVVARRGAPMIVVNPEPNPFSEIVDRGSPGVFLEGNAGEWVPELSAALAA